MTDVPANAAPVTDHPALPELPTVPVPLPPATWPEQQQAAVDDTQAVQQ